MAHAAAHLKKARELEHPPEYIALQKARERRRRRRERAERKQQVKHIQTSCPQFVYNYEGNIAMYLMCSWPL